MKLRTIALAVALACGLTAMAGVAEAKNKYHAKRVKVKKYKKHKFKYNVKSR